MKILVINGANLNSLGKRDINNYGSMTLLELNSCVGAYIEQHGANSEFYQSNHEGSIIDRIQQDDFDALIINAGAYTHYSYAIRDALECNKKIKVEVHLSDIYNREDFRRKRVFEDVVDAVFYGKKEISYYEAALYCINRLKNGQV